MIEQYNKTKQENFTFDSITTRQGVTTVPQRQMPQQQLTDQDIAGDVLTGIKFLAQGYMHATMESQNQNLHQTFKDFHDQHLDDHWQVFQFMKQNGWYKVPMILDEEQQQSF